MSENSSSSACVATVASNSDRTSKLAIIPDLELQECIQLFGPPRRDLFFRRKLTSRGPGFYRQQRVGLDGKPFYVVKLRSMVVDAERPGEAVWCVPNDARVTRLGGILRFLHLDELPQLLNVVKGEMCLVGPRPERPKICEELAQQIDGYYDRNTVKPGITGLAQINLPPDETIDDVRKKQTLDLNYIAEANLWLDTRMMLITAMYMFGLKGEPIIKLMGLCRQELLNEECADTQPGYDVQCSPNDVELAVIGAISDSSGPIESAPVRHPR